MDTMMVNIIGILIIFSLVLISAFYQFSILAWTILIGAGLVLVTIFMPLSLVLLFVLWVFYLLAAGFSNLKQFRIRHIVNPMLKNLQAQMPSISPTEREALEAGNTWWEKELFCGRPDWNKLLAIPKPTLSAEEEAFLANQVETVCSMLNDWEIVNDKKDLPEEVWNYLKQERFFGMAIPKEYGGRGFSALAHSTVVVKIATRSVSAAVTTMVPNSLGPAELLYHYGTEEQKAYYLPRLARGEEIPCFALTAPEAGSDAGSIPDTGIVCKDMYEGKEVVGIRLTWDKRYITLAPVATVLGLAFQMYDPDKLLGDKEEIGITLCLLPTSHPGVEIGHRHLPMHLAFMNGPTRGKDVFIPLDWIIGGTKMAGQGWRMLMECLSIGRSISLPALATACGKGAYRYTGAYAKVRKQFNTSISNFEGIEEALGYIAGYTYMLEATRIMTAGAVDQKIKPSIASAIAKYHMTELSRHVVDHAMDVHAGHAIQVGPRNFLANVHMAVPISITVEGANILTRNLIIFGQGAIRCHPYILKEVELITAETPNTKELDKTLMSHIGYFAGNLLRTLAYGLTGGKFIITHAKNKRIHKYLQQLTRMSAALALLADASLILLGGSLKRRERISARLGDIMSNLYIGSAVLKYYADNDRPKEDLDYVCWSLQLALYNIQNAADGLLNNYPNKWVGKLLRAIIFPLGAAYSHPKDKLQKTLLSAMLEPNALRDRLTKYCYIDPDQDDLCHRLDTAMAKASAADPIARKLHKAVQGGKIPSHYNFKERVKSALALQVLTTDESTLLSDYESLKNEIIKVNEFSFDLSKVIA